MTKPANSTDKPSPSDTPTHRPDDNGGKSIVGSDDLYTTHKLKANKAKQHENEEQPVQPVKDAPKERGTDKGQVQQ